MTQRFRLNTYSLQDFTLNVLNGNSLGIIIALIPAALTSQLLTFFGQHPWVTTVTMMTNVAQSMLPIIAAFAVGAFLRLGTLESAAIALASIVSGGVVHSNSNGLYTLAGSGAILNVMLVTYLSAGLVLLLQDKLGQLKLIFLPTIVLLIGGSIGLVTLPWMLNIQGFIGSLVASATHFSPLPMGIILGMAFAALIVSPLSSVGIATAINLAGVGAGAANAGIVAGALTLAWMSATVNPIGGTIAHVIGSPKIQMANLLKKPLLFVPVILAAGITGGVATLAHIQGTPFSAGFGASGLIGPLTAWQVSGHAGLLWRISLTYLAAPVLTAWLMTVIFVKKTHLIMPATDLKIPL
ncbi:PTS sugar transporter subunit IIC [Weissella cibaria]|uniref:PTS sugar transporter subunit IIC n=1 Tax=Weissella cibaria TaxID=137591 RepID=A0A9Q8JJS4_9LACO|nr:PTS sugar transporter subunit IIC [Weissella cibaria]QDG81107.1 PTS sugar transporter subunit IIC [Weissella cibaria]QMU88730.1 PTS sugar transporter subunit IIC [Weissella cibaria]TVV28504.1 PTS sugar transporter subunit IIC [Weissella cibaria]TVV37104.1 PTS sugar transporter subunit IIC [Weissella cibaria]TVV41697.1 PTS sugar transporter subunit IIC [Weissella cibaria]